MNKFKSIKKQLKFCIQSMEASSSLFVVDPERDFTRRRKHLFGNTMMNVLLLEAGSLKDELFGLFGVERAAFAWRKALGAAVAIAGIIIFRS